MSEQARNSGSLNRSITHSLIQSLSIKPMKKTYKLLCAALLLAGLSPVVQAQVKFKLSRTGPVSYQVSMVPEQSLGERMAITGTMQVTFKVATSASFELTDIQSLQNEVEWDNGSVLKSPDGARTFDFISVALKSMGTRQLSYEAGKEVPLFSFRNAGNAASEVALLDNQAEPLVKAPQNHYNVGNHISVLGFGNRNAYTGNLRDDSPAGQRAGLRSLYPNPATSTVTVTYDNYLNGIEGGVKIEVADSGTGRTLLQQDEYMKQGTNQAQLNISQLNAGIYLVHLRQANKPLGEALKLLIVR